MRTLVLTNVTKGSFRLVDLRGREISHMKLSDLQKGADHVPLALSFNRLHLKGRDRPGIQVWLREISGKAHCLPLAPCQAHRDARATPHDKHLAVFRDEGRYLLQGFGFSYNHFYTPLSRSPALSA